MKTNTGLIRVKSRVFPEKTYLTKNPIIIHNRRQNKANASPISAANLIVGVFRKKYKIGRSYIVEYTSQFGEHKKITLARLKQLGIVPNTVIDNTYFQKTRRIEHFFSDDSFQYLCHTIADPSYTPKIIIGMLEDYIDVYGFDMLKNKKHFKTLLKYCAVIRPDLLKNHDSISYINKILLRYKAKNNELIPTNLDSKSMSNKKHRNPYGSCKSIILDLAVEYELKKKDTPLKEEVLKIMRHLKNRHGIDATEASVRKTLQRGGYSDSSA